jgi:site-specific recombinase XerD
MIKYHPLEEIKDSYLENLDLKHRSIKDYGLLIDRYIHYLKRHNIKYAKRPDIIKYRDSMWEEGLQATTIQKQMVVIKNFYKWIRIHNGLGYGFDEDIYKKDVSEGIKGAKIEKRYRKEALSLEQAKALIRFAEPVITDKMSFAEFRNYAMLLLMLTTGLRTIEVARAKISDLDTINGYKVLYIQGKGKDGNDNFVKLSEPVQQAIKRYLYWRTDHNKYLFAPHKGNINLEPMKVDSIRHSIKQMIDACLGSNKRISVHSLRHTCATLSLQSGNTLEATQQLLRHANIETTLIYAHHLNRLTDDTVERITEQLFEEEKRGNES